jgi:hypothetical protein
MEDTTIQVNEQDLASVLQKKIGENVNLQLQIEAMARVIADQKARIVELVNGADSSLNGKEAIEDANSREEKVPLHIQG